MEQACNYKSIFDTIEEDDETPQTFTWSNQPSLLKMNSNEYICDGMLINYTKDLSQIEQHYVLTLNYLYLCEPLSYFNSSSDCALKAALRLKNPRLKILKSSCGFRLMSCKTQYDFFAESFELLDFWLENFKRICVNSNIEEDYVFKRFLGKGNFSRVHLGVRLRDNGRYAIKSLEKSKLLQSKSSLHSIQQEITVLRELNHPNIVQLHGVYENDISIQLVMEYLEGGDLLNRIKTKGTYLEREASKLIKHVLDALNYCHSKNIIHRDLKPENIVLM